MTTRLQEAIKRAEALPPAEQDRIADLVLDGLDVDRRWDEHFAETADGLEKLTLQALERNARGQSIESGWGRRRFLAGSVGRYGGSNASSGGRMRSQTSTAASASACFGDALG